jgi:hypothetical protein
MINKLKEKTLRCTQIMTIYQTLLLLLWSRDSSDGIPTEWTAGVRFLEGARVETSSEVHLASYIMGTRGPFLSGKAAGALSWPQEWRSYASTTPCLQGTVHN